MNVNKSELFSRTELLIGRDGMERLSGAHVAIFGIGGVGGHAFDALLRSGVGRITVVDADTVSPSNLNRQLLANLSTVGKAKTSAAREHAALINPDAVIIERELFFSEENADSFDFTEYDYVIDAIDSVRSKLELISRATDAGTPIISSMGAGNKLDPTAFEVSDIYKTSVCPLAKAVRTELRRRGIKRLKVVYSKEEPKNAVAPTEKDKDGREIKRHAPGSIAFVPSVVGLIIAGEVIKDLTRSEA